ncbi:MAG TPA: ABC transporter substrate-binding protein [Acidimicrobiales bacterium]|nr:ABC transporter substrate-binding protein [Acidimicrobiales bacterium]
MLLAAACGDDGGGGSESTTTKAGGSTASTTTLAPQKGGIATIGQFSAAPGLDPAKLAGGGTVGGMEHMAIYDVLMRYNNVTGKYEPRTAASLTPNADNSVWTLKLKPNVKFTDGTPYDAAAVKFVHDREVKEGNSSPRSQFSGAVKSVDVIDALTVQYTLTQAWAGFPYILSGVNGIIYSPTAFAKAGANFNTAPGDAGAGPFKLKSYKPGESIELERNPTFYGGDVYLDGLKFVFVGGFAQTYEAVKAGTITAAFVRDNATVAKAKAEGFGAVDMPAVAGNILNMNSGVVVTCNNGAPAPLCTGKANGEKVKTTSPTSDRTVRLAVAHAVDPKVISDRVYDGKAQPNSAPFANFPWDPKVEGPKFDLNLAKQEVTTAKAAGWNGKIRVLSANTPEGIAWGQAVSAMLTAAGMEVALDTTKDTQQVVNQVLVLNDYDVVTWAYGLLDESDANYLQLKGTFNSAAPRYGYGNAEMDAAIDLLRVADTDAKRVAAYKAISEIWVRDVPAHVTTAIAQDLIHSPKLHDPQRTAASTILFDKAWLEK